MKKITKIILMAMTVVAVALPVYTVKAENKKVTS